MAGLAGHIACPIKKQKIGQDYNLKITSQWSLSSNKALSPRGSTAFPSSITNLWPSIKAYKPMGDISHSNYNIYVTYKNPALAKLVMDTFNPITWKAQSDVCLWVCYQHGLYTELQISHSETMSQKKTQILNMRTMTSYRVWKIYISIIPKNRLNSILLPQKSSLELRKLLLIKYTK